MLVPPICEPHQLRQAKPAVTEVHQLIARKGLGKARHLDVDLLWIQSIPRFIIKAIKGKDNPADLGTKSLSKDKIREYMASLGYVGEFVDQEEVAGNGQVRRLNGNGRAGNGRKVSEGKLTKIIQAVTMGVLVALGEAKKFGEGEENAKGERLTLCMRVLIVLIGCACCYLIPVAAVLRIKLLRVERKERREGMAEEHSEVMEQRVEELAEMRQGAMARRENLLQENAPDEEKKENAPEKEEMLLRKKKRKMLLRKKKRRRRKAKKRRAKPTMSTPRVPPTRPKGQNPRRLRSQRILKRKMEKKVRRTRRSWCFAKTHCTSS